MALLQLPITNSIANYRFRTRIEGIDYIFRFRYGSREDSWFMDIRNSEDILLLAGIRVVVGIDLTQSFKHLAIPQGPIFAENLEDIFQEPTRDNFGTEVLLLYSEVS